MAEKILQNLQLKTATVSSLAAAVTGNALLAGEPILVTDAPALIICTGANTYETLISKDEAFTEGNILQAAADGGLVDSGKAFSDSEVGDLTSLIWSASKISTYVTDALVGMEAGIGVLKPAVQGLADLKAIDTTNEEDKTMVLVEDLGLFRLDLESSETADDSVIVAPTTGSGRWIRMTSLNTSHNSTSGLQGGDNGNSEYYHLSLAEYEAATRVATTEADGLMSSAQVTELNSAVKEGDILNFGSL